MKEIISRIIPKRANSRLEILSGMFIAFIILFLVVAKDSRCETIKLENIISKQTSQAEFLEKKQEVRAKLLNYLGPFPKEKVPLSIKSISEQKIGPIIIRKVSYLSQNNDQVYAYLLVPQDIEGRKLPAILALHQTVAQGKDEVVGFLGSPDLDYGLELAERGYVVLAPDMVAVGDRISEGEQAWSTENFYKKNPEWSAVGKAIWDNMISLDYLQSLPYVDKNRIGVIGHSQGGIYAYFLAAFDKRIKAAVANCGLMTIAGDPNPLRWARENWWIGIPSIREDLKKGIIPFDIHEVIALIPPRAFLAISATKDESISHFQGTFAIEEKVYPIYKLFETPENLQIVTFSGIHSFPSELRQLAYEWLDMQLKK